MTTTSSLKARLNEGVLLAPGVYDALSALIAAQTGFEALYLSGASIAYTRLGRSDIGLTTYPEVEDTIARIAERVSVPVIVDADTGFGNALNVKRTVRGFERAGAAMIQLEDQTFPKRCGHLDGKGVIPAHEMAGKIRAAVDAGVTAYSVEGLAAERLAPILEVALARFAHEEKLRARLAKAESELADRKLIDRAKRLLMDRRRISEQEAYAILRKRAMDQGEKLVEVARQLVSIAELLG